MIENLRMSTYAYQPEVGEITPEQAVEELRSRYPGRVRDGGVHGADPTLVAAVSDATGASAFRAIPEHYRRYVAQEGYATRYAAYYRGNQAEKSFEHWVTLRLLGLRQDAVFIDVAGESSPLVTIAEERTGCRGFIQDIMFPPGVNGNQIGGDACAMPVPDGFADAAALTCSLEHFERDADTRLIRELARVLKPGGRVVIVPLYITTYAAIQTDPVYAVTADVRFDSDAVIHAAAGWRNRHARYYSPETLRSRILAVPGFDWTVYRLDGAEQIHGVYARFALCGARISSAH